MSRPTQLLHITLANVGVYSSLPDDVLDAAVEAGSTVRAAPFVVTFDRISSFKGSDRRPLVLRRGPGLPVRDLVLVHGLQGRGRHMHHACWPLRG